MLDHAQFVRSDHIALGSRELLQANVSVLLGVSPGATAALQELLVVSVFDLATSEVFGNARTVVDTAESMSTVFGRFGGFPRHFLDRQVDQSDLAAVALQPIEALHGMTTDRATRLSEALGVTTLRDLAYWPPYVAASRIMRELLVPQDADDYDQEAPAELIPRSGEYPTEKSYYSILLLDSFAEDQGGNRVLTDIANHPVDVTDLAAQSGGFREVAYGALVTYEQSWYAQGVALGNLLQSIALAPGESTRIALVDWQRRTRGTTEEEIAQTEFLDASTEHNRSINEVTQAVATEAQNGFSKTTGISHSANVGQGYGAGTQHGVGGGYMYAFGGIQRGENFGLSGGQAVTAGHARSASSSFGVRNVFANLSQNIAESTQQHASSSRNRRAAIVTEVSQEESEKLSTRVLTNYNHMHALTIQYYEVLQIYRVRTRVSDVDKCIFVPMKVIESWGADLVRRYRHVLHEAALDERARVALELAAVDLPVPAAEGDPELARLTPQLAPRGRSFSQDASVQQALARAREVTGTEVAAEVDLPWLLNSSTTTLERVEAHLTGGLMGGGAREITAIIEFEDESAARVEHRGRSASLVLQLSSIRQIRLRIDPDDLHGVLDDERVHIRVVLTLNQNGVRFYYPMLHDLTAVTPWPRSANVTTPIEATLLVVGHEVADLQAERRAALLAWLHDHLSSNRVHYSQAIWQSLDRGTLTLLLSGYSHGSIARRKVPLLQVVDPNPIMLLGNYLVFRMNVDKYDGAERGVARNTTHLSGSRLLRHDDDTSPAGANRSVLGRPEVSGASVSGAMSEEALTALRRAFDAYMNDESDQWQEWLADHGYQDGNVTREEIVPLPSGGVFAEAVLGRFNASEKLDLSRFWNWQDSPIPIGPSEIAPLSAGGKTETIDPTPGRLDSPIINMVTPAALPDPQGMSAILSALATSNMFRDMSGLADTIAMAGSAMTTSSSAATAAGAQAAGNLSTAAQTTLQGYQATLDFAAKMMSGAAAKDSPSFGKLDATEFGGLLNATSSRDHAVNGATNGDKSANGNSGTSPATTPPASGAATRAPGNGSAANGGTNGNNGNNSMADGLLNNASGLGNSGVSPGTGETTRNVPNGSPTSVDTTDAGTTYRRGRFSVFVAADGAIQVAAGDWLSKYSAAIHGNFWNVYEYSRKNVAGQKELITDVDRIYAGEVIYHTPEIIFDEDEVGAVNEAGALPPLMTEERRKELVLAAVDRLYGLTPGWKRVANRMVDLSPTILDTLLQVLELAGVGVSSAVSGLLGAGLIVRDVLMDINDAYSLHARMYAYRAFSYALTSWVFGDAQPRSERALENLLSGATSVERRAEERVELVAVWDKTCRDTRAALEREVCRSQEPYGMAKLTYQSMFKVLGEEKPEVLARQVMQTFEGEFSSGVQRDSWTSAYSVEYPD